MPWQLIKLIGVGSFGEVWHARLPGPKERQKEFKLAIKMSFSTIHEELVQREISLLKRLCHLTHQGLLRLVGLAVFEERLFVQLELAEESLFTRMTRYHHVGNPFPIPELIHHTRQIAAALDHVHGLGIIHGGVNPTDLLLCGGQAKLADFCQISVGEKTETSRTQVPFYKWLCMSPELKHGQPVKQSDQYALAATYAWLRLQHPIDPVIPPMGNQLTFLPEAEREAIMRALSSDPIRRFASCQDFVEALASTVTTT
jgi:serine/threonine protein kinase